MKSFKILSLSFIFLLSIIFGITIKGTNNINNRNNINNSNNNDIKLVYEVTKKHTDGIVGTISIDNYEEYLNYKKNYPNFQEYDEEFFNTQSIIIYGTWESSGSNIVEITSLELDKNNNLTLNVYKKIHLYGTCDMRYHGFIIEYQKLNNPINKIILSTTIGNIKFKEYIFNENKKAEVEKFLKKINYKYEHIEAYIRFTHDDVSHLSPDAKKAYFEKINKENVSKYKIDHLNGSLVISSYSPTVYIRFNSFDNNELNKLYNISQYENIDKVYLWITFEDITITKNVIKK